MTGAPQVTQLVNGRVAAMKTNLAAAWKTYTKKEDHHG